MKSTRMAAFVAVIATSLLAVCASSISTAATDEDDHDQRCIADPGQHARGDPAVQQPGQGVPEGQPVDQGQARRVPVDRADVRGQARRRHVADGVRGALHGRPDARGQRPARRPDRRGQERCRTSRSTTRPFSPRARRRRARSSRCRRVPTRRRCTTTASSSAQAGLDPNKPPTTWAQLQAYAKQIAQKTGKTGYAADGQGRQHGRLDPDDGRVRARRADGSRARERAPGRRSTTSRPSPR